MDSQTSISNVHVRVFKYRWVVLGVFCLSSIINFMQLLQFAIVANVVSKFYHVEDFLVDLSCMVFFIAYIVAFLPISYLIEKYSLKFTVISATALTLLGNLLKLPSANPDRFWLVLTAQTLCAIGQVALCSLPSKLATTWFGPHEVSTACAIAVLGMQLGSALGCVQSPFLVKDGLSEDVESQLFDMFLYQVIVTASVFAIVLAFFRSKPPLPPSQSQLNLIDDAIINESFFKNMKKIAADKNFWFIVFSLGLANGLWNAFGILLNSLYLNYFPKGESDAGLIGLIAIISGGCIGSLFFGILLDKTHNFKKIGFSTMAGSSLSFVLVVVSLLQKSRIGSFVTIPIFGFFLAPVLIIGFEFLVEVTYPIPEACSSSTFNAAYYLLSIVATLLLEGLIDIIDYMWTFVVIFVILCTSSMLILMVKSDLKRREANLKENEQNCNTAERQTSGNTSSTLITIARL